MLDDHLVSLYRDHDFNFFHDKHGNFALSDHLDFDWRIDPFHSRNSFGDFLDGVLIVNLDLIKGISHVFEIGNFSGCVLFDNPEIVECEVYHMVRRHVAGIRLNVILRNLAFIESDDDLGLSW